MRIIARILLNKFRLFFSISVARSKENAEKDDLSHFEMMNDMVLTLL